MLDPRTTIIGRRLSQVENVVAVSSGKGGVGKSVIASILALTLARKGFKVGLMDLDFTSPSTHLILGVKDAFPEEREGIVPPEVHGVKFMSITYFSMDKALPLRGQGFSDALLEILAITRWGELDYLILDMPPGISDATLDVIRYIKDVKFIVVTTPSILSYSTAKKLLESLYASNASVLGVVENMDRGHSLGEQAKDVGAKFLGKLPFDPELEKCFGKVQELLSTRLAMELEKVVDSILSTKKVGYGKEKGL